MIKQSLLHQKLVNKSFVYTAETTPPDASDIETLLKNVRRVFSRFWKCFVLRKGFKDKYYGFLIGLIAGLYPLISFLKLQLLMRK